MEIQQEILEAEGLTKEEWLEWQSHPVTKLVDKILEVERERWLIFIANRETIKHDSAVTTEEVVGRIQGINDFLLRDFEESKEDKVAEGREKYGY